MPMFRSKRVLINGRVFPTRRHSVDPLCACTRAATPAPRVTSVDTGSKQRPDLSTSWGALQLFNEFSTGLTISGIFRQRCKILCHLARLTIGCLYRVAGRLDLSAVLPAPRSCGAAILLPGRDRHGPSRTAFEGLHCGA